MFFLLRVTDPFRVNKIDKYIIVLSTIQQNAFQKVLLRRISQSCRIFKKTSQTQKKWLALVIIQILVV
ncbi:hypothetical protein DSUL_90088 [Desulfovibrionales bacterium]